MIHSLTVDGVRGASGNKYVKVSVGDARACIPIDQLVTDEKGARIALARQGVSIIGAAKWRKLIERISDIREFREAPVIEKLGWNGNHFCFPDGTIYPKSVRSETLVPIELDERKCARSGSLRDWKNEVARPLEGQYFATFILTAIFAAPLLSLSDRIGNFGFEIVGGKGTGKSTLQYIVSSAAGGTGQGRGGHYWITLDTTVNALEDTLRLHADFPVLMDEANLLYADASNKERASAFKALAFKMASGAGKDRYGIRASVDHRCVYITSSNEPLASLLGQSNESAKAAADRLITLPLSGDRAFGVFDRLPDQYSSASAFAEDLMRAARVNYGHGFRRFIKKLVTKRVADELGLQSEIRELLHEFREKAGINSNNGSDVRVADAFGLVYAAGEMAQRFGVLPKELRPAAAALKCYQLHRSHVGEAHPPFSERLAELVASKNVTKLKKKGPVPKGYLGYIKESRSNLELLIPSTSIVRLMPDWDQIKRSHEVQCALKKDGSHLTVKRTLGGKNKRVYCFALPSDATESE